MVKTFIPSSQIRGRYSPRLTPHLVKSDMKKTKLILLFALLGTAAFAQKSKTTKVPLAADKWTYAQDKVTFGNEKGTQVMKILPGAGKVIAKEIEFTNGTVEFDIQPLNPNFAFFHFRYKDAEESESFYFRTARAGNPTVGDAVQYTPIIKGVNFWDMLGHYQTNATFALNEWNHVKVVVNGSQMRLFVNSSTRPTLEVDHLEGNQKSGSIAFEGEALVANLVVKAGDAEGLAPLPGIDPTHQDPRYIRSWAVSEPFVTPKNVDFSSDWLPTPETTWQVMETERRGLLNLTRKFGKNDTRRITWLKLNLESQTEQKKKIDLGFSDEVWVYLNGQIAYVDKNLQGRPIAKYPDGRCSVENTSFVLPLRKGNNELLIGLASDFFGWGVISRLEDLEGLKVTPDPTFDARLVKLDPTAMGIYAGRYVLPDGRSVVVTQENNFLKLSGQGFLTAMLYPKADNKFFMREFNLEMEFNKNGENKVSHFILYNDGKQLMEVKRVN